MIHPETHLVTEDNGPRPAGKPNECFYCHKLLGLDHQERCVCRKKTVVVRMTVEYTIDVPEHWEASDIEFHRNESSWCCGNAIGELVKLHDIGATCFCHEMQFAYLRDATLEDERTFYGEKGWQNEG